MRGRTDDSRRAAAGDEDVTILRACTKCGRISDQSRCPAYRKHKVRAQTPNRKAIQGRGAIGKAWRRERKRYLEVHPTCEECMAAPSSHVHHKDGGGPTGQRGLDPFNFLAVCPSCHGKIEDAKRIRDESGQWQEGGGG